MDAAEEIRSRLSIEDVVGEYVQLKRAGRNWRGLSPFTNERTPSFMVSPEKQIWHDFSSGKGGNMFSFVMDVEGLDFKGALELLARKAGVDLDKYRRTSRPGYTKEKDKLYEVLELATKFYQVQFSKNNAALEYIFKKRQFDKSTALTWRIGYSPNNGTALMDFLKTKGFDVAQMRSAGLLARTMRGGNQDMFRGRIMIPLADPQGRVIGYTARMLVDEPNAPKYINTPQTALYDKSRHVFGLHLAKESIRKNNYAVVVEGNMDVIASHSAGVNQVVATAGTALTKQHLKLISRFTNDIRLSFDMDSAGLQATERSIPLASDAGVSLGIITIPSGKDPDELIKQDPKVWEKIITEPQYALDWLIERYEKIYDINTALGKRKFSDELLPVIQKLADQVEKDHYITELSSKLQVSSDSIKAKLADQNQSKPRSLKKVSANVINDSKEVEEYQKTQEHLLSLVFYQPKMRTYLGSIDETMVLGDAPKKVVGLLKSGTDAKIADNDSYTLRQASDYVKILSVIYEELYQGLDEIETASEAERLSSHLIEIYARLQKQRIAKALLSADESQTKSLLEKAKEIDKLLKANKGRSTTNAKG